MSRADSHIPGGDPSPFSPFATPIYPPGTLTEGPVTFLLVAGELDDTTWGLVGAYWLSIDGHRGGFLVSPRALWTGTELLRSYRGAQQRGWTEQNIYSWWYRRVGVCGGLMIDPQQRADSLFQVARRLGIL